LIDPAPRRTRLFWTAALVLATSAATVGCGKSPGVRVAPVRGVVTYHGQPVGGAQVTFFPDKGRLASGTTQSDGNFALSTIVPGDGALLGHHRVCISKRVAISAEPYSAERDELPANYGSVLTSKLEVTVADQPNDFQFDLAD
jgi:hypothetical protein